MELDEVSVFSETLNLPGFSIPKRFTFKAPIPSVPVFKATSADGGGL